MSEITSYRQQASFEFVSDVNIGPSTAGHISPFSIWITLAHYILTFIRFQSLSCHAHAVQLQIFRNTFSIQFSCRTLRYTARTIPYAEYANPARIRQPLIAWHIGHMVSCFASGLWLRQDPKFVDSEVSCKVSALGFMQIPGAGGRLRQSRLMWWRCYWLRPHCCCPPPEQAKPRIWMDSLCNFWPDHML